MFPSWWRLAADAFVKVVSTQPDTRRQSERDQSATSDWRLADKYPARTQQWRDQRGELLGQRSARMEISCPGVEMR